MKDLIIKSSVLKKELSIWLLLFGIAFLINIYAIIVHSAKWIELLTQLHVVFIVSAFLYFLTLLIRTILYGIRQLLTFMKSKKTV